MQTSLVIQSLVNSVFLSHAIETIADSIETVCEFIFNNIMTSPMMMPCGWWRAAVQFSAGAPFQAIVGMGIYCTLAWVRPGSVESIFYAVILC